MGYGVEEECKVAGEVLQGERWGGKEDKNSLCDVEGAG